MREILFKAKTLHDDTWETGDVIYRGDRAFIHTYDFESHDELYGCPKEEFINFIPVDPNTVCQYTGLTDKNGVKIFEGDNINSKMYFKGSLIPHFGYIVFDNGCFKTQNDVGGAAITYIELRTIEVIGNIHD